MVNFHVFILNWTHNNGESLKYLQHDITIFRSIHPHSLSLQKNNYENMRKTEGPAFVFACGECSDSSNTTLDPRFALQIHSQLTQSKKSLVIIFRIIT